MFKISEHIGIPFIDKGRDKHGCDCWGLVGRYYRKVLSIILIDYNISCSEHDLIADKFNQHKTTWIEKDLPSVHDVVLMSTSRNSDLINHVGVYVAPGRILHTTEGYHSRIDNINRPFFHVVIKGYYEYART